MDYRETTAASRASTSRAPGVPAGSARLASLLLASRQPDRLRAWYASVLGVESGPEGFLDAGAVSLLIGGRDDVADVNPEPGRLRLRFSVDDVAAVAGRAARVGAARPGYLAPRREGLFATLVDPDGSRVEIVQPRGDILRFRGR